MEGADWAAFRRLNQQLDSLKANKAKFVAAGKAEAWAQLARHVTSELTAVMGRLRPAAEAQALADASAHLELAGGRGLEGALQQGDPDSDDASEEDASEGDGSDCGPQLESHRSVAPVANRYARVAELLREQPEIEEWVAGIADRLCRDNFAVVEDFLDTEVAHGLLGEVQRVHRAGQLKPGELAGGRSGQGSKKTLWDMRGDSVGWFAGDPCHDGRTGRLELTDKCWPGSHMQTYQRRMDSLAQLLATRTPELQGIESRSEAMVTCYPGSGAHYIRHSDNPNRNGRRLTVLLYLNFGWRPGDGGELRVHRGDGTLVDLAPRGNRLVVFFSDNRVMHEVLPTSVERFAITHWFYDLEERRDAEQDLPPGTGRGDQDIEQRRLEAEFDRIVGEAGAGSGHSEEAGAVAPALAAPSVGSSGGPAAADGGPAQAAGASTPGAASTPTAAAPTAPAYDVQPVAAEREADSRQRLRVRVQVPGVASAALLELDCTPTELTLRTTLACPVRYELTVPLPHRVEVGSAASVFKRRRGLLIVTLTALSKQP